jgi:hypothetical protein
MAPSEKNKTAETKTENAWIDLFNGQDLTGWQQVGQAAWKVERGAIVGTQGENHVGGDLLTEATYKDFLLTATYQVEWPCNSGIWFRYASPQKAYQVDILEESQSDPPHYSGSIYRVGTGFIAANSNKDLVDREGWNTISVRAEGNHLQAWLNGNQVADVTDDTYTGAGQIGIQVHSGADFGPMKIAVREIRVQPIGSP